MLLLSYLSNLWQSGKIKTSFSSWKELLQSMLQGSVLFFFLDCNVWNFADDATFFVCNKNLAEVKHFARCSLVFAR